MKKLITLALLFVVLESRSQSFEGTVKWTMKMDITDPKMKAEMDKMNDPANQAKMKELQAQMNDPKMKAAMEANPQMKAQMEAMMKMQQGGGMNSMMPNGIIMKIKGNSTLTIMDGGMMGGMEILHMKDKNQTVRLDRANKTYIMMPSDGPGGHANAPIPKVTKTSETAMIAGYNCTKYLAEVTDRGQVMNEVFWTTTDIKDFDTKSLKSQRMGQGGHPMLPEGIDGVPMKIETSMKEGKMVMEVTEVKRESLNAADFVIPSDFKEGKSTGRF